MNTNNISNNKNLFVASLNAVAASQTRSDSPSEASCFVCGEDDRSGWFAQMSVGRRTRCLCSAPCALKFFEAEEAPAHDHRARHNFKRARAAIVEAAYLTTRKVNL
jgi:hypothetical protein